MAGAYKADNHYLRAQEYYLEALDLLRLTDGMKSERFRVIAFQHTHCAYFLEQLAADIEARGKNRGKGIAKDKGERKAAPKIQDFEVTKEFLDMVALNGISRREERKR